MHARDEEDRRLDELLGQLKEGPVSSEELQGAWLAIESGMKWRRPMNPIAATHPRRFPRLVPAMAAAAVLMLAFVVGAARAPVDGPGFGDLVLISAQDKMAAPADAGAPSGYVVNEKEGRDVFAARRGRDGKNTAALRTKGAKYEYSPGGSGGGRPGLYDAEKANSVAWVDTVKLPASDPSRDYKTITFSAEARDGTLAEIAEMKKKLSSTLAEMKKLNAETLEVSQVKPRLSRNHASAAPSPAPHVPKPVLPPVQRPGGRSKDSPKTDPPADPAAKGKSAGPVRGARKIIKTATLALEIPKFSEASRRVDSLVAAHGGFYADSKTTQNDDGTGNGYYVIRVPQARFESLYAELKKLGRVKTENAKGVDVTAQYTDMRARIRNLEHIEKRLLALLDEKKRKGKMSEILEVERELGKRREQIERMQGQMRVLVDRISLGTIHLTLSEPSRTVPGASFTIEVKDASATDKALDPLMAGLDGQVVSRRVTKRNDGTKQLDANLKVPMTRFGDLLNAVKAMGRPDKESVQGFNPAAIRSDPGAADVMSTVRVVLFEPARQKPGGTANIEVRTLEGAAGAIGNLLKQLGGQLVSRNEQRNGSTATAAYQLRVPRSKFAQLAAAIEAGMVGRLINKRMTGVDVVDVDGPLAKVPCELTLTVQERQRQKPTASATLVAADLAGAGKAIRDLLKTVDGQVTSHIENRLPGGTSTATYQLRCPRERFEVLLAGLYPIGRLENKSVSGLDLQNVEGAAAKVLCTMTLTVMERVPGANLRVEVSDIAEARNSLEALVKSAGGRTERVDKTRRGDGSSEQLWLLRVPVTGFSEFVEAVERTGQVKTHEVVGLGAEARSLAARNAYARVRLVVYEPSPLTAASEGTFTGTLSAAFKTLWWLLAVVLYGLIVVLPVILILAFVIKGLAWLLRGRRKVAPVAAVPAGDAPAVHEEHKD